MNWLNCSIDAQGPQDTRLAPQGEYNNVCTLYFILCSIWNLDMVGSSSPFQSGTHAVSIVIIEFKVEQAKYYGMDNRRL
jgi:hypothetical protein